MGFGRPKNIKDPAELMQHFNDYREIVKGSPIVQKDWVGKDADEVYREKERPLTIEGFENHLFTIGVINDIRDYFNNKQERYTDFAIVCRAIKNIIRQDQIEGGMAGIYNPSITQRLNGLAEKTQTALTGENGGPINIQYVAQQGNEPIPD